VDSFAGLTRLAEAAEKVRDFWAQGGFSPPLLSEIALQPFLHACLTSEEKHKGCGLDLVYHWTKASNMAGIARDGLLPMAHGQRYGKGVYTSPRFGFGNGRYGNVAVLCIGLRGEREVCDQQSSGASSFARHCSSWDGLASPEVEEVIVYRDASQVLPCAFVTASELNCAMDVASATIAMLYHYFPRLGKPPNMLQDGLDGAALADAMAVIDRWEGAKQFLKTPALRLRREKAETMEFPDVYSVYSDVTVSHRLAEWQIVMQLPQLIAEVVGQQTFTFRVLFPKSYPDWAPHILVVSPRVRSCSRASQLLIVDGGINVDSLLKSYMTSDMKMYGWVPTSRITHVVQALQSSIAKGDLTLDAGRYSSKEMTFAMRAYALEVNIAVDPSAEQPSGGKLFECTCPPAFAEVLKASCQFQAELGSAPNFPGGRVSLAGKLTRRQLHGHTAFEHVQLSVQGFAKLEEIRSEVCRLNNGRHCMDNPGTQLLEQECGFTMHADYPGTATVLHNAPALFLHTFELAKDAGQLAAFFSCAFDRHSDPCLESRVSLLVAFWEEHLAAGDLGPISADIGIGGGDASTGVTTSAQNPAAADATCMGVHSSGAAGSERHTAMVPVAPAPGDQKSAAARAKSAGEHPSSAAGREEQTRTAPVALTPSAPSSSSGSQRRAGMAPAAPPPSLHPQARFLPLLRRLAHLMPFRRTLLRQASPPVLGRGAPLSGAEWPLAHQQTQSDVLI